jgi:hypothetical protein
MRKREVKLIMTELETGEKRIEFEQEVNYVQSKLVQKYIKELVEEHETTMC